MTYDNNPEAHTQEYLAGAGRALTRGDAVSTAVEVVQALQMSLALVRQRIDPDSPEYRQAWERISQELSRLPPSFIREAVRIIDDLS